MSKGRKTGKNEKNKQEEFLLEFDLDDDIAGDFLIHFQEDLHDIAMNADLRRGHMILSLLKPKEVIS